MKETKKTDYHQSFILYKPYGYLSQFVNNGQKQNSKKLLGSFYNFPKNSMSIGRLDEKSEGLLLITTDGKLSNHINSSGIEKEYYAQVDGIITDTAIQKLRNGIAIGIEGEIYHTKTCKVRKLQETPILPERGKKIRDERHGPTSWVAIILQEGKFRQVRKMTAAAGFPTLRLVRVRVGNLTLDTMTPGTVREINPQWIQNTQNHNESSL